MWIGTRTSVAPSGLVQGMGATSFQQLLRGNTMLTHGGSRDFNRLLGLTPHDARKLVRSTVPATGASRAAARRLGKVIAKQALRQGFGANPYIKAAEVIMDMSSMLGVGYQIPPTVRPSGDPRYVWASGPVWNTAYTDPFPVWPFGSIPVIGQAPPLPWYQLWLPRHPTNHQYWYGRYAGRNFFGDYIWAQLKAIRGGPVGIDKGPGYAATGGGWNRKRKTASAAGRYRWLREQKVALEVQDTAVAWEVPPSGPAKRGFAYGRPYKPESKAQVSVSGYRTIIMMANALGGFYELVDLLADAADWKYDPAVGGSRLYNKVVYLWFQGGLDNVDWHEFEYLRLENELEDWAFAKWGDLSKLGSQGIGRLFGLQTGLVL